MTDQQHPKIGDHVTIGTSKAVWRVDYAEAARGNWSTSSVDPDPHVELFRMADPLGKITRRYISADRLTVVGSHERRKDFTESPQNCQECGLFREVKNSV